jgi:hypothetical protein
VSEVERDDEDGGAVERDAALEPPIRRRELPDAVPAAREREHELEERLAPLVEPRISGWVLAHGAALDTLAEKHQQLADRTDITARRSTRSRRSISSSQTGRTST